MPVVDLEYQEDCVADVDMNVVMTGSGRLIEVQATAETEPFERSVFNELLGLAEQGIARIRQAQTDLIAQAYAAGAGSGSRG